VVVECREVGGQQHDQLGQVEVVLGQFGEALEAADGVVADVADHAAGERGEAGQRFAVQDLDGLAQCLQRVTVGRQADRRGARPVGAAVALGEGGGAVHADETPPRPGPAVLGRLEQEGARAAGGELAVDADGGLGVGEEAPGHGDHASFRRELVELLAGGADGAESGGPGGRVDRAGHAGHCAGWASRRCRQGVKFNAR
jgi:hypothetical protein